MHLTECNSPSAASGMASWASSRLGPGTWQQPAWRGSLCSCHRCRHWWIAASGPRAFGRQQMCCPHSYPPRPKPGCPATSSACLSRRCWLQLQVRLHQTGLRYIFCLCKQLAASQHWGSGRSAWQGRQPHHASSRSLSGDRPACRAQIAKLDEPTSWNPLLCLRLSHPLLKFLPVLGTNPPAT